MLFEPDVLIYVDGASRGNPGKSAYGFAVYDNTGRLIHQEGKYIGEATNNVAEYTALIKALEFARKRGITTTRVFSDSQLLVRQMNGEYRVKSAHLLELYLTCRSLAREFEWIELVHVPREENSLADSLANQALDDLSKEAIKKS